MKPWQVIAFEKPCFLAEETAHQRYGMAVPLGSLVFTVNAGYE